MVHTSATPIVDAISNVHPGSYDGGIIIAHEIHLAEQIANYKDVQSVAIIGAGVAGLQAARLLSQAGKQCVLFEASDNVGGVWQDNYADFGLQVPRELYEFPGFPWPEGKHGEFPSGPEVQNYIEQYSKTHDLRKLIKFKTKVRGLTRRGVNQRGWTITYEEMDGSNKVKTTHADFCIVATGMYSSQCPSLPLAENHASFKGDITHSSAFTDCKAAAGKHVLVVGGGKSAIDCAVAAAKEGKTCTLVTREMHWPVPRHLLNLVPFKWGTYSRFGTFMLDAHHEQTPVGQCFHGALVPVKRAWWRVVEMMFRGQFRLSSNMVPATRIEHDVFNGGQILSYEFKDMLRKGQIKLVVGEIDRFHENGAVLKDGTDLACEMVVYGTGFRKNYDIFEETLLEDGSLDMEKDGLYLYRNIIPPKLPNLAFIGSEVSTFNNILSQGLQIVWLARILTGQLVLPKVDAMEESLARDKTWKRSWMPASKVRASIWQLHMMKYHDTLLRDMGENHLRKGFNVFAEVLAPYRASDYADLFQ